MTASFFTFVLTACEEFDPDFSCIDSKDLNDFGVDIRYPGDLYTPSAKKIPEHKLIALQVKELVESKLKNIL